KTMNLFTEQIREHFLFLDYAPIVFVSAKTKQRVHNILPIIKRVSENHAMRIESSILNEVIDDSIARNPAPTDKGRRLRIYYATQGASKALTFVASGNEPGMMLCSYERFLENRMRETFDFEGTPVRLITGARQFIKKRALVYANQLAFLFIIGFDM